jgi:hypothetical protein
MANVLHIIFFYANKQPYCAKENSSQHQIDMEKCVLKFFIALIPCKKTNDEKFCSN